MTIDASAKVNLTLRILHKRPDGFHEIETLMAPISLADQIDIEIGDGEELNLTCSDPSIPTDSSNLVSRAVFAFSQHTGRQFSARIHLQKNIPHGAGLGGGSSDAASVLKALDALLQTRLSIGELESIASTLGSDIPFFIRSQPAICRGRGEMVEPFYDLSDADLLLIKPPFPIPTPWAYQAFAKAQKCSETFEQFHGSISLMNDLEAPVFEKYLVLPVLKSWILEQSGVSAAMMSGSGSTIFAILKTGAACLEEHLKSQFGDSFQTFRCRLLAKTDRD